MSGTFDYYSRYYDLLYNKKDYRKEISYVLDLIKKYSNVKVAKILDLGCGTGNHATYLSNLGFSVLGIDQSEHMIGIANNKHKQNVSLAFEVGDIRTYRDYQKRRFDAIISLFHVVSYLNTNDDLLMSFETARCHLEPGGVFIFDCWYGPAVMSDLPTVRFRELEDEQVKVRRVSIPTMRFNENIVDVQFKVMVVDKATDVAVEIDELHSMRYLFIPEIENLLKQAGLRLLGTLGWLEDCAPGKNSWNAVFIAGF